MSIKRICAVLFGTVISISMFAQTITEPYNYFRKGFYLGVDASAGLTVNDRISISSRNSSYGLDIAAGYRFCPQFVVAGGFGGHAFMGQTALTANGSLQQTTTTSVPVFIRFRSDLLDRKVSPYAQLDLGYSFVFLYSKDAGNKIKYNNAIFMNKVEDMGFETLDKYEEFFRNEKTQLLMGSGVDEEQIPSKVDALWKAEVSRLKQFSNGRYEYIPMDDFTLQYGKNGLFANLDLGVSWCVGEKMRMNAGVSVGLSQSYYGTCLRTNDNDFLKFGRLDYLPYEKIEDRVYVRTLGQADFKDSFELDLRVKLGFSF